MQRQDLTTIHRTGADKHHHTIIGCATPIEETYNSEMGYEPTTNSETYEVAFFVLGNRNSDRCCVRYLYYSYIGVDCLCDCHELD
jgi:hypothetical protein